ncbi:hypothetical protein ScPMuIL_016869 [Solemya velum]
MTTVLVVATRGVLLAVLLIHHSAKAEACDCTDNGTQSSTAVAYYRCTSDLTLARKHIFDLCGEQPVLNCHVSSCGGLGILYTESDVQTANPVQFVQYACTIVQVDISLSVIRSCSEAGILEEPVICQEVCPVEWKEFGQSCYYFSDSMETWHDAEEYCISAGGYLIEIESEAENNFVAGQIQEMEKQMNYWIGGTDEFSEGSWRWSYSGRAMVYTDWYYYQPDNARGENYGMPYLGTQNHAMLSIEWSGTFMWDDNFAKIPTKFLCERKMHTKT